MENISAINATPHPITTNTGTPASNSTSTANAVKFEKASQPTPLESDATVQASVTTISGQLIEQIDQPTPTTTDETISTKTATTTREAISGNSPESVLFALTPPTQQFLNGVYIADNAGNIPAGQNVSILDTSLLTGKPDGTFSPGDSLIVTDAKGQQLSSKTLLPDDTTDLIFRNNLRNTAIAVNDGWKYTSSPADLPNNKLESPETRNYADAKGIQHIETVYARNDYWEIVAGTNTYYMLMRQQDTQGNAVKPSDAINHIVNQKQDYHLNVATAVRVLNLKASIDTIGADDFDKHAGQLVLQGAFDQHDTSNADSGFKSTGDVNTHFNPSQGDALKPGSSYVFNLNNNAGSSVYLGKNDSGTYQFWTSYAGVINLALNPNDGSFADSTSYLSSYVGNPDVAKLNGWDASNGWML